MIVTMLSGAIRINEFGTGITACCPCPKSGDLKYRPMSMLPPATALTWRKDLLLIDCAVMQTFLSQRPLYEWLHECAGMFRSGRYCRPSPRRSVHPLDSDAVSATPRPTSIARPDSSRTAQRRHPSTLVAVDEASYLQVLRSS